MTAIDIADAALCALIAFCCAWVIRQSCHARLAHTFFLRICLASLALSMVQKVWSRFERDVTTPVDLWRDGSLAALLLTFIVFYAHKFRTL